MEVLVQFQVPQLVTEFNEGEGVTFSHWHIEDWITALCF